MPYSSFLRYLEFEKRYSKHTLTAYGKDLEQFFAFLEKTYSVKTPSDVTFPFVRSWIVELMEMKTDARTVKRKISSLRSFFRFLLKQKKIEHNPMLKITAPKISKKLPVFVDAARMNRLLDNIEFEKGFKGVRNKLVISIFYQTGMRLSELINITDKDVNLHNLTIKVLGKRNKERLIPITPVLKREIEEYFSSRKQEFAENNSGKYFLVGNKGNKLERHFVYRIVKNKLSAVTSGQKKSPHVLRHSFATEMLNSGADINAVKEILGHASLAATQVYTHNTIEKLKNIYKQAHPKA